MPSSHRRAQPIGILRMASTWTQVRPLREEVASATTQGGAAAASAAGLVDLVTRAWSPQDALELAALVVHGASMFIAFLTSALYHGVRHERAKPILQQIDHCAIFLPIAGTDTPVAVLLLRHRAGMALLASIWILAVAGIVLRLRNGPLSRRIAVTLYLVMGWLCIGGRVPLYQAIGTKSIFFMITGGLSDTGGLFFYGWHRLPFRNYAWHLCVVAGSVWFFIAITRLMPT